MNGNGSDDETEIDRSGNTNTLYETTGDEIDVVTNHPTGYSGSCRDFEDTNTEAFTNGTVDVNGANVSMALWIKNETGAAFDYYVSQYGATTNRSVLVYLDPELDLSVRISLNGSAVTTLDTGLDSNDGVWQHVGWTYDGTTLRSYTNGVAGATASVSGTIYDGSEPFIVGAGTDTSENNIDGLMDELIMFNRTLTPTEMLEIYTSGIDGSNGGND